MPTSSEGPLRGLRIGLLIEDGFSARQVQEPTRVLSEAGADVVVIGNSLRSPYRDKTGTIDVPATMTAGSARAADLDALIVPGGHAPDKMRMRHQMVELVAAMAGAGKPVAAICHGVQVLISADVVRGRTLTCWPSIAVDVRNAGGRYVDRPAVHDEALITARKGDDVPAFLEMLIAALTDRRVS